MITKKLSDILKSKGWEFLEYDGWYMFVKDKEGKIFPICEIELLKNNLT